MDVGSGVVILLVGLQRWAEWKLAQANARWVRIHGGYECGKAHFPLLVGIHGLWFAGMILEAMFSASPPPSWWWIPWWLFLAAQGLRVWSVRSLGPYWNTRILVVPGHRPVIRGPYRYFRHPNYAVVVTELFTLPILFGAFVTAGVITLLNLIVLIRIRIPAEERALSEVTAYGREMASRGRWLPRRENGKTNLE